MKRTKKIEANGKQMEKLNERKKKKNTNKSKNVKK